MGTMLAMPRSPSDSLQHYNILVLQACKVVLLASTCGA